MQDFQDALDAIIYRYFFDSNDCAFKYSSAS